MILFLWFVAGLTAGIALTIGAVMALDKIAERESERLKSIERRP